MDSGTDGALTSTSDWFAGQLSLIATADNINPLGVPAAGGVPADVMVSLFDGEDAGGMALGAMQIDAPLLPGASAELVWDVEAEAGDDARSFFVVVDGTGADDGRWCRRGVRRVEQRCGDGVRGLPDSWAKR